MEPNDAQPEDIFREFEQLLGELRRKVDSLRDESVDAERLRGSLAELDELAGRAAAVLERARR